MQMKCNHKNMNPFLAGKHKSKIEIIVAHMKLEWFFGSLKTCQTKVLDLFLLLAFLSPCFSFSSFSFSLLFSELSSPPFILSFILANFPPYPDWDILPHLALVLCASSVKRNLLDWEVWTVWLYGHVADSLGECSWHVCQQNNAISMTPALTRGFLISPRQKSCLVELNCWIGPFYDVSILRFPYQECDSEKVQIWK